MILKLAGSVKGVRCPGSCGWRWVFGWARIVDLWRARLAVLCAMMNRLPVAVMLSASPFGRIASKPSRTNAQATWPL